MRVVERDEVVDRFHGRDMDTQNVGYVNKHLKCTVAHSHL
jgi:hypothetical protein